MKQAKTAVAIPVALILWVASGVSIHANTTSDLIGQKSQELASGTITRPSGAVIRATEFIPDFYASRENEPIWVESSNYTDLISGIEGAYLQGLRYEDFHLSELEGLQAEAVTGNPDAIAEFEIVATDAAVRLVHHLFFGKVDAATLDPDWNFERPVINSDPVEVVNAYLSRGAFSELLGELDLDSPQYDAMVEALARYRALAATGGWPRIEEGETIKPGMTDPRIPTLRARLEAEGFLTEQTSQVMLAVASDGTEGPLVDPELYYDPALVLDVERFQDRMGLEADGVIGPRTLTVLNRTVDERIDQIRLSLERARWLLRGLGDDFVLVNIAGAHTYLRKGGQTAWTTRSITGSAYRKTPVFRDEISYMEVNPTWTVPASIFRKDKLSAIRKDRGYLDRGGYSVRSSDGQTISAGAVNWNAKNPGVTLVQKPGPNNALGLIKFMFPNKYAVYLHDTNDRSLFDRNERNLSSGCIRVQHPFELANLLMADDPDWNPAKLDAILESGKTTRIELPEPMPVLLTYWTAWVGEDGIRFREDIYERDGRLLEALDGAF